jgi:hypothetical protein
MTPLYAPGRVTGGSAQISHEVASLPVVQSMFYWLLHVAPRRSRGEAMKALDHQFPSLPELPKRSAVESWEAHLDRSSVAA